jgi:undecaprenyl-diphosphatase
MGHLWLGILGGILQGVVEWLPVSSKTINLLLYHAAGLPVSQAYTLGLVANFGSFFAALFYFRREIAEILRALRRPLSPEPNAQLLRFMFWATLATGLVGIPVYEVAKHTLSVTGGSWAMLLVGCLLLGTGYLASRKEALAQLRQGGEEGIPSTGPSLLVGALQGLAALPGVSRSGVTVTPLLAMGYSAAQALRLSFLLDVVALLGAGLVPLASKGGLSSVRALGTGTTLLMLVVAGVVSFLAIGGVLRLASRLKTSTATYLIAIVTIAVALAGLLA